MWSDHLTRDFNYAFRLMRKNWALSTTIILTLALGIGANSVVFSVVRAVVLRPLEYAQSEQLVQLWDSGTRTGGQGDWVSFPDFRDWRSENRVFQEMAAYRDTMAAVTGNGEPESIFGCRQRIASSPHWKCRRC
jgi:putative ABC transport system permease protein